jgi:predicted nuclease of predicted toxin-antitoxin system
MTTEDELHDKILKIIRDYLGPAADRFLARQAATHLRKEIHQIEKGDVHILAIRIRSGLLVLTKDEGVVDEAFRRIAAIADQ